LQHVLVSSRRADGRRSTRALAAVGERVRAAMRDGALSRTFRGREASDMALTAPHSHRAAIRRY
jgi:hypothetical protein